MRCAVAASSSSGSSGAGRRQQDDVALGLGQAVGDGGAGLGHLLGLVEGGRARHLQRGQAPHGVVGRLVEGREEGQEVAGVGRAVHVALDGVGPGLADELGLELLAAGGVLPDLLDRGLGRGQHGVGLGQRGLELGDLGVEARQLAGDLVDLRPGVGDGSLRAGAPDGRGAATPTTNTANTAAATSAPRRTVSEPTGRLR